MIFVLCWGAIIGGGALPLCLVCAIRTKDFNSAIYYTMGAVVSGLFITSALILV